MKWNKDVSLWLCAFANHLVWSFGPQRTHTLHTMRRVYAMHACMQAWCSNRMRKSHGFCFAYFMPLKNVLREQVRKVRVCVWVELSQDRPGQQRNKIEFHLCYSHSIALHTAMLRAKDIKIARPYTLTHTFIIQRTDQHGTFSLCTGEPNIKSSMN